MQKIWNGAIELRANQDAFGLTQEELGKRIGVSRQYISSLENERKPITEKMAKSLAEVLDNDYHRFLRKTEDYSLE